MTKEFFENYCKLVPDFGESLLSFMCIVIILQNHQQYKLLLVHSSLNEEDFFSCESTREISKLESSVKDFSSCGKTFLRFEKLLRFIPINPARFSRYFYTTTQQCEIFRGQREILHSSHSRRPR
ncbi:hypothetical protein CDAR_518521 [Caerostris darwini]|uniref:Maturase K n=1 Tax=Caerostris darwini TaxID=1538125 RepID=A0AAV4UW89_9ARAC|nr:hypothetical protein CDAR_518521 [Caerostris darwini]